MSHTIVTKENLARVREQLRAAGKKVTVGALRAGLGDQGSMSTIVKFKKELDEDEACSKDSPEALRAFRDCWSMAKQSGISQRDEEVQDLRDTIAALEADAQRFEGEALAAQVHAKELGRKLDEATDRFNGLSEELTRAREVAQCSASKLVTMMEEHTTCQMALREQMAALEKKNHELELELAKVVTRLEMSTRPHGPASTSATRVSRRSRLMAPHGNSHGQPKKAQSTIQ